MHNFKWVSSTTPKFIKNKDTIPRKRPRRRKDGRTDRLFFTGPLWLPPGVFHFWNRLNKEYLSSLQEKHYYAAKAKTEHLKLKLDEIALI